MARAKVSTDALLEQVREMSADLAPSRVNGVASERRAIMLELRARGVTLKVIAAAAGTSDAAIAKAVRGRP